MPIDLPTTLSLLKVDLALIEEALNGLENTECADKDPADQARIKADIATVEHYRSVFAPIVAGMEAAQTLGYPLSLTFRVSEDMKARIQKELKASIVADSLYVGVKPAVSGMLNFGRPVPTEIET